MSAVLQFSEAIGVTDLNTEERSYRRNTENFGRTDRLPGRPNALSPLAPFLRVEIRDLDRLPIPGTPSGDSQVPAAGGVWFTGMTDSPPHRIAADVESYRKR